MKKSLTSDFMNREIVQTSSKLKFFDYLDHWLARWGVRRSQHIVKPGLYSLGNPDENSRVFVTANYTLSFDALRSALAGVDCYILVLDTKGINVWCAAGKGTFGTDELVHRIKVTGLNDVVNHKKLILPQLGAPGVASHIVKQRSGYNIKFGPVRAEDLPGYLKTHKATKEMRRVKFKLKDRFILIPVELVGIVIPLVIISALFYLIGGLYFSAGAAVSMLVAVVLFPILLPWLPTHNFSTKGLILGVMAALPFAIIYLLGNDSIVSLQGAGWALSSLLILPPITSFITLNFTGATTFTSRSGVKQEMYTYIPLMAWLFGSGLLISISLMFIKLFG